MTRPDTELAEGLKHVGYEVFMAAACASLLRQAAPIAVRNALLESMLVHIRSLTDFLIRKIGNKSDDMVRTEFAPKWEPEPTEAVQRLRDEYETLNKHLAHLTWVRLEDSPAIWNPHQLAVDIVAVAEAWSWHVGLTNKELFGAFRQQILDAMEALGIAKPEREPSEIELTPDSCRPDDFGLAHSKRD